MSPVYLTSVKDGAFYGWPYSYYGPHVDKRGAWLVADDVGNVIWRVTSQAAR